MKKMLTCPLHVVPVVPFHICVDEAEKNHSLPSSHQRLCRRGWIPSHTRVPSLLTQQGGYLAIIQVTEHGFQGTVSPDGSGLFDIMNCSRHGQEPELGFDFSETPLILYQN